MGDEGQQRRLSAILAADVAGYTRLMEQDTDGTVAAWQAARADIIDPAIAEHSGRIVKHTGDGFLAEFPTVQQAVICAISIQERLTDGPLDFRMGGIRARTASSTASTRLACRSRRKRFRGGSMRG